MVNDYNVQYPLEVYNFFKSTGSKYIQFSPVVERLDGETGLLKSGDDVGGKLAEWSVPALAYGRFLNSIFDEWARKDVGNVYVTTFDSTLAGYVGADPGTCIWAETCKRCNYLSLCNGECPKNRIQVHEGEKYPLNHLCSGLKLYFSHTEPYMRFMANELNNKRAPANLMNFLRNQV